MNRRACTNTLVALAALWVAGLGVAQPEGRTMARIRLSHLLAWEVADELRQPVAEFRLSDGSSEQVKVPAGLSDVRADTKRNELTVTGTAEAVATVQDLMKRLDVRPGVAYMQAKIVEYDREDDIPPSPPAAPGALLVGKAAEDWLGKLPQRLEAKRARVVGEPKISFALGHPALVSNVSAPPNMSPPRRTLQETRSDTGGLLLTRRPFSETSLAVFCFGSGLSFQCWRNDDGTLQLAFVVKLGAPSGGGGHAPAVCFIDAKVAQGSVKVQSGQPAVVLFPIPEGGSKRLAVAMTVTEREGF